MSGEVREYRVKDPQWSYPIGIVHVMADDEDMAKSLAAEAMFGCPLLEVDKQVVDDMLRTLEVAEYR